MGTSYGDIITGSATSTFISAGWGNDLIVVKGDTTVFGGEGADTFRYDVVLDGLSQRPLGLLFDFGRTEGDKIDLSAIDANSMVSGNQAFIFLGTGAFTGVAGELRFSISGNTTLLFGDVNGDSVADFSLTITDATPHQVAVVLQAEDFVL